MCHLWGKGLDVKNMNNYCHKEKSDCEKDCIYVNKWKEAASDLGKCFSSASDLIHKYEEEIQHLKSAIMGKTNE